LKGVTTTPEVFLGGSIGSDANGTLHWGAKRYISRSMEAYERIIGVKPIVRTVPLPDKTQPEMDATAKMDAVGRSKYQSLIMTMSRFRTAPRTGHLAL
jgi:hypothetical protein